ncbi:hypothetical protein [uncultured Piscinibacter sp.]|uniref:Kelch repeat-containing protein n=1 Tax=uncultured Piscinibacter sp. TaxID=1131835 RepID=UPI00262027D4|nr:hypothetical protein [uncultured Piscinibacter sp.]
MQRRDFLAALTLPLVGLTGCGGTSPSLDFRTTRRVGELAVSNHASVTAADGSVIVIGGDRGLSTLSDAVDRFEPSAARLARIATLSSGRDGHQALLLQDGRILVSGGQVAMADGRIAELIDPLRGTVNAAGHLNLHRRAHAMTLLNDGRVLASGGVGRDSVELWDPQHQTWRLLPSRMQHARAGHSATLLADGCVLLVGGDAGGYPDYRFAELWDPRTEAFTPLDAGIEEPRMLHAAWRTSTGDVIIVGGEIARGSELVPLASAWRYEAATSRFDRAPGLATARTLMAVVPTGNDHVLLIGGQTAGQLASRSLSAWSDDVGEAPLPELPSARVWHTANPLADGRVLVIGGENGRGGFASDILVVE